MLEQRASQTEVTVHHRVSTDLDNEQFGAWNRYLRRHNESTDKALKSLIIEVLEKARLYGEFQGTAKDDDEDG